LPFTTKRAKSTSKTPKAREPKIIESADLSAASKVSVETKKVEKSMRDELKKSSKAIRASTASSSGHHPQQKPVPLSETMIPMSTTHTTITAAMITSSSSKMNSIHSSMTELPQTTSSNATSKSSSKRHKASSPPLAVEVAHRKEATAAPPAKDQHQPYSTSLVNSGFGFGFDLQGGDADNQLTFIVNVHPNGDASRKGLTDGK
jgi:hypothetical protein